MLHGECLESTMLADSTSASVSGLLPTVTASDGLNGGSNVRKARGGRQSLLPTVVATEGSRGSNQPYDQGGRSLTFALRQMLPTVTVRGNYATPREGTASGWGLAALLAAGGGLSTGLAPTATVAMAKGGCESAMQRKDGRSRSDRLDYFMVANGESGPLSPLWVEWFMGWPVGWTGFEPLGMDKFLEWQSQHGWS
jgi:hypothetical protein